MGYKCESLGWYDFIISYGLIEYGDVVVACVQWNGVKNLYYCSYMDQIDLMEVLHFSVPTIPLCGCNEWK